MWFERIVVLFLVGGFATYPLFKDFPNGSIFDPKYWADDVLDDDFGG